MEAKAGVQMRRSVDKAMLLPCPIPIWERASGANAREASGMRLVLQQLKAMGCGARYRMKYGEFLRLICCCIRL